MDTTASVDLDHIESTLQSQLGPHAAAVCCSAQSGDVDHLTPDERATVACALIQRQREFASGRLAARSAMRRLGAPASPVPSNPDRSPRWPEGLVGSISHCRTACVAVVARSGHWSSVGIDLEPDTGLASDLWNAICTPQELQKASRIPEHDRCRWVLRVFCAKEAYYKWVYPHIRSMLDFQDVNIDMDASLDDGVFRVDPLDPRARNATPVGLEGTLISSQGLVLSMMIH